MGFPESVADILPLTSAQRGILFHVEGETHLTGQYVAVVSCRFRGNLDPGRLKASMETLTAARDAFRTGFVWKGVKEPVQVVQKVVGLPWTELDWTDKAEPKVSFQELLSSEQRRPFDLKNPPLMAVTLIKISPDEWWFLWTVHHLISDGWSTNVALQDLFDRYHDRAPSAVAAPNFKTYLSWLKSQGTLTDTDFWGDYLSDLETPTLLPEASNSKLASTQSAQSQKLGAALMARVRDVSADLKVTPNTILSAAWALVLRKQFGQNDIVLGTTTTGRPAEIPGISQSVGAFINTLPVRFRMEPSQPVEAFLRYHSRAEVTRAKHEHASLAEVQSCAPLANGAPVFDTLFVNEGVQKDGFDFGDIEITDLKTIQFSNYPLSFLVAPQKDLEVEIYFDPARIDATAIGGCIDSYRSMLIAITEAPETPIQDLMSGRNFTVPIAPVSSAENVVQRFLRQAQISPSSLAVSDAAHAISYFELSKRARQIAHSLRLAGVGKGDIVPVAVPRGADAIAAFLGVMMAGAAYVPLDIEYPKSRLSQIIDTTKPRFVVTSEASLTSLPENDAQLVFVDSVGDAVDPSEASPGALAYVMFTSGSENRPKGVVISQRALAISTASRDDVYGGSPEVYLLLSSLAFDSSVAGVYWTLSTGGHLVIADKSAEQRPGELGKLMSQNRVTHTLCLPSLANALLASVPKSDLQSLKVLIAAGEALPSSLPQRLRETLPNCMLMNEYGPTEGTVWCTSFNATAMTDGTNVPIGTAIPGTWVGITDIDGCPVGPGTVGEIVVAGETIAEGYLRDQERTERSFFDLGIERVRAYRTGDMGIADANGCITFLGRKDKQTKIRGHRVELSEIEVAAQAAAGARRLVAIPCVVGGSNAITMAIECLPDDPICETVLKHLEASLPEPFHPSAVIGIAEFPVLPNGKLDQNSLKDEILRRVKTPVGSPPRSELEQQLAVLYSETLKTPVHSRDANFFDLGGDSLATIMAYALGREQGIEFEPTDLFACPSVSELAKRIEQRRAGKIFTDSEGPVQISNQGPGKTTVVIAHCSVKFCKYMARSLGKSFSVVHIPSHRTEGMAVPFDQSLSDLASEAIAHIKGAKNTGPFMLCGYSAGCPMVMEMARQLGAENTLGMILLDPPFKMVGAEPKLQPFYFRTYKRMRYIFKGWKRHYRARHILPELKRVLVNKPDSEEARIRAVEIAHELAISDFRVPRFDPPAHIFLSRGNPSLTPGDVLDTHLRDKELYSLDMEHVELMQRPDVFSTIASVISKCATDASSNKERDADA